MDFKKCVDSEWGWGRYKQAAVHLNLTRSTFNSYMQYQRYPRARQLEHISNRFSELGLLLDAEVWRKNYLKNKRASKR